jgi:phage terminase small subunit
MTADPSRLPVPRPTPALPRPPAGLGREARKLWRDTLRDFELQSHHLAVLEQACRALDVIAEAEAAIARDGAFLPGRFGVRSHPVAAVRDRNRVLFSRCLREVGLDIAEQPSRPPSRWHQPR